MKRLIKFLMKITHTKFKKDKKDKDGVLKKFRKLFD